MCLSLFIYVDNFFYQSSKCCSVEHPVYTYYLSRAYAWLVAYNWVVYYECRRGNTANDVWRFVRDFRVYTRKKYR